jgi:hypothetical protein
MRQLWECRNCREKGSREKRKASERGRGIILLPSAPFPPNITSMLYLLAGAVIIVESRGS